MTRSGRRATALATVAALLAVAATGCGDDDKGQAAKAPKLTWDSCPAPSAAEGIGEPPGAEWQCAALDVPLDYADPDGDTIELALIRAKALDKKNRIGSLVYNFGGPGGSGVANLPGAAKDYQRLRARYDLVSFDPRGVGRSAAVRCESDQELDAYYQTDSSPEGPAEEQAFTAGIRRYAAACEKNSGTVLPHVGTLNAARDLDRIRAALGDEKLHYFGISYGTELGGVYAHLFPAKVGRAVFDAVVDPTKTAEQSALGQAKGFQLALGNFAQDCVERGEKCLLPGATAKEVEQGIVELQERLRSKPIAVGTRKLTETAATNGIAQALYSKEYWPLLEQGLDEADGGQGQLLLALSDAMNGRNPDGTYSNLNAANTAINCADSKERFTLAQTKERLPRFRAASAVFGDFLGWGLMGCSSWPVAGAWQTPDVSAAGSAPILVIGNTGDPATPYEGARRMVQKLGPGVGVELTYEGEGHGAYNSGDPCVQKAVDAYLLQGTVPPARQVCPGT
ncbi:alpha/beta hydrolase [Streptomyces bambusae]|uniref:alpha/beta hydrolase n=1 Tax=Streptomyces bambusae TaxID=1550616 RepID=UPI001CFFCA23|nr:alpha/beta hydrolase [Streptomyces bambusae]MCB5169344.1 alpha/beta hydrolase [Streptomyces bambusae]